MGIAFDSTRHKYSREGQEYVSVTTLLSKYQKPFNKDYWALYKAVQSCLGITDKKMFTKLIFKTIPNFKFEDNADLLAFIKAREIDPKHIKVTETLSAWTKTNKDACEIGTQIHETLEKKDIIVNSGNISDRRADLISSPNYQSLEPGYYSELRLYLDKYKLAGTADKVLIYELGSKKYFYIADYKTNKKLTFENKYQNLLYPLNHLQDTKFNIYALQMSIYAYMLEQQFGVHYTHSELIHYTDYDINKETVIPTPYLKKEVEILLNHYKNASG